MQRQTSDSARLTASLLIVVAAILFSGMIVTRRFSSPFSSNFLPTCSVSTTTLYSCNTNIGQLLRLHASLHTNTHTFNSPFSGTTRVSRYQKGKTNLDFTEAKDSGWQGHQLGYMQVCTLLQTENHTSTPQSHVFYRPDALPAAQPKASKH